MVSYRELSPHRGDAYLEVGPVETEESFTSVAYQQLKLGLFYDHRTITASRYPHFQVLIRVYFRRITSDFHFIVTSYGFI